MELEIVKWDRLEVMCVESCRRACLFIDGRGVYITEDQCEESIIEEIVQVLKEHFNK